MEVENFSEIMSANLRLMYKSTIVPAVIVLAIIPLIYGTSNLDAMKSAACLEQMAALIGIPMFVPILYPEQRDRLLEIITVRFLPYWMIVLIRIILSTIGSLFLIILFEIYMCICGDSFPFFLYMIRTLVASMILGLPGLFLSSVFQNTIVGYLVSFNLYFFIYMNDLACFKPVTNGISCMMMVSLCIISVGIVICNKLELRR